MTPVKLEIERWVRDAAERAVRDIDAARELPPEALDPMLKTADPRHGDYQANLAMRLGKQLGQKPRDLAESIATELQQGDGKEWLADVSVAGPGFINLALSRAFVESRLRLMFDDARLGLPEKATPSTVVVDYSSPNLAKEMHIGHLRSTIIGDAICRVLGFVGETVIRHNHLGDWGTQFGMLLEHLIDTGWDREADHSIGDLNLLYQEAKTRFDADPEFKERSRKRVVALQAGDEQALTLWRQLIDESARHMNDVYAQLGVLLCDEDIVPESFYNQRLPVVVSDLREVGVLVENQGAMVAFPDGFKNKEGEPLPLIVQKSDGGYGYATTDLAAARYRAKELGADRIVYVVDARQSEHFAMLFATLKAAGWVAEGTDLEHVPFGTILGKDRKPFQTRTGGTVRLVDVLNEATSRARQVIDEKSSELPEAERADIASAVGIGAIKYADLSSERIKDYTFDYDRMLSLEGNTSPYLQNAYVRIQSIFRKGGARPEALQAESLQLEHDQERALAMQLFKLPDVLQSVASSLEPHRLCNYLYELASGYHSFYEHCRVLDPGQPAQQASRLALSRLVADSLRLGLDLLGIRVVQQM